MKALLALILFCASAAHAGLYDEIPYPEQRATIDRGEMVYWPQEVIFSTYPRIVAWFPSKASPSEMAAVFHDYALFSRYSPEIREVKVSPVEAGLHDLSYVLKLNPLFNERIDATYKIVTYASGSSYYLELRDAPNRHWDRAIGTVRIEPFRGGSIIRYLYAPITDSLAERVHRKTFEKWCLGFLEGYLRQVDWERRNAPEVLRGQLERLSEVPAGECELGC